MKKYSARIAWVTNSFLFISSLLFIVVSLADDILTVPPKHSATNQSQMASERVADSLLQQLLVDSFDTILSVKNHHPYAHVSPPPLSPTSHIIPSPLATPPTSPSPTSSPRLTLSVASPSSSGPISPRLHTPKSPTNSPTPSPHSSIALPDIFAQRPSVSIPSGIEKNVEKYFEELMRFVGEKQHTMTNKQQRAQVPTTPFPIDIFIRMEQSRKKKLSEEQQIYNKLLFDAINETIALAAENRISPSFTYVAHQVEKWTKGKEKVGDDVIGLIMQEQHDTTQWMDTKEEKDELVKEIVSSLFTELLDDTIRTFNKL